jgi:hypothetical protein
MYFYAVTDAHKFYSSIYTKLLLFITDKYQGLLEGVTCSDIHICRKVFAFHRPQNFIYEDFLLSFLGFFGSSNRRRECGKKYETPLQVSLLMVTFDGSIRVSGVKN